MVSLQLGTRVSGVENARKYTYQAIIASRRRRVITYYLASTYIHAESIRRAVDPFWPRRWDSGTNSPKFDCPALTSTLQRFLEDLNVRLSQFGTPVCDSPVVPVTELATSLGFVGFRPHRGHRDVRTSPNVPCRAQRAGVRERNVQRTLGVLLLTHPGSTGPSVARMSCQAPSRPCGSNYPPKPSEKEVYLDLMGWF